ncbi:MAG TPA: alpha/beta hydrolase [Streptosporangiaceae bacterium]|jgi:pimeloyl-ACP methyl ester carboxylesterase|nr:alpha/beta hydrolase [Streptosporangiaceae bacterium]
MRGYADTRWGQLHYSSTGSGDQAFVLLHETPLNHAAFQRLVPLLADGYRVVAFDSPGYGESDGPSGPTSAEDYAKTLTEGIESLSLDRVIVYGVHTGGTFAVQLAATLGDRAEGLALTGVPYYTEEVRKGRRVRAIPPTADDGSHLLNSFDWEPAAYDAEVRSRLVAGIAADPVTGYQAFHAVYGYQPGKYLAQISAPVLLVSHPSDPLYDFDNRFKTDVPQARQVIIDTERLPVYWTAPDQVAAALKSLAADGAKQHASR